MTDVLSDHAARLAALDPSRSFLVQAPAGSGKTELLIQRYLTLLARAEQPEEVVAITFTRKAAGEMRNRVLTALAAARGQEPSADHAKLTWRLGSAALDRDRELGWNVEQHPSRLRIQTIDALSASMVRQMPWLSRFGVQVSVVEDADELHREAARETLSYLESGNPWAESIATLLKHLDNNFRNAETLIAGMLDKRDQWLPHIGFEAASWRPLLEQTLACIVIEGLDRVRASIPADLAAELVSLAAYAASNMDRSSAVAACIGLSALPPADPAHLPAWLGIADLVLTQTGEVRKQVDKRIGFPPQNRDMKVRMERVLRAAVGEPADALAALRGLPAPEYSDDEWRVIEALLRVLPVAAAVLQQTFARRGQADFTEFAHAALLALGTPEQPTELAFALDCRVRHLLVDEFQDTSITQYKLFEHLTREWQDGDGRTLFLVGDPMQSIFGFREANVALFLRARAEGLGDIRLEPLRLETNFRSDGCIVQWVNDAFTRIFPEREDRLTGAVTFSASTIFSSRDNALSTQIYPLFERDGAKEAAAVVRIIQESREARPEDTIAVLVRARTHCQDLPAALNAAGIPFQAVDFDGLGGRPVVQDLLALTRALVHLGDRVSWLALLRAPWCGLTLADLYTLTSEERRAIIYDLLTSDERVARLSEDGQRRVRRIARIFTLAVENRRRMRLCHQVRRTWTLLGGPACLQTESQFADAEAFLTALDELDDAGDLPDFARLDRRVERLFARPESSAPHVQMLTMHKAKGLEFDTVILAGLGNAARNEDERLLYWLDHPDGLLFAPNRARGSGSDAILRYLKGVEDERREQEARRLLYVAATRARCSLHLVGHAAVKDGGRVAPRSGSLLEYLWPVAGPIYEQAAARLAPESNREKSQSRPLLLRRVAADWQAPEVPVVLTAASLPRPVTYVWTGETLRHVGTVVHRELDRILRAGVYDLAPRVPGWRAMLANLGVPFSEMDLAVERVRRAVEQTLADDRGRWILAAREDAQSELALSGIGGDGIWRGVIDRTFVENGVRWIVDYKTGIHEGGDLEQFLDEEQRRYAAQFERYATLMQAMDATPVRFGLYFPLLSAWREWSADPARAASG